MDDEKRAAREEREREIERIKQEMLRGPPPKPSTARPAADDDDDQSSSSSSSDSEESGSSSSSSSSSSEEDEEEQQAKWEAGRLPLFGQVPLAGSHSKSLVRVALDKNATRLVSGSLDGSVFVWDFALFSASLRPFRTLATTSSLTGGAIDQAVTSIEFNCTSAMFGVARADPQIRIYTRDGNSGGTANSDAKATTTRGDAYIRDMAKTKGHVGGVSGIEWHHAKPEILFSAGELDGTIRIWDVEHGPKALMGLEVACTHILRTQNKPGSRTSIQAFCRSSNSTRLVGACSGGSINLWDARMGGVFSAFADKQIELGANSEAVVDVRLDSDDRLLAIAQKNKLNVFDTRKLECALWSLATPGVRSVLFRKSLCLLVSTPGIHMIDKRNGQIVRLHEEANIVSNLRFGQDNYLCRGHADGSLAVSVSKDLFEERRFESQQAKPSRAVPEGYARLDESALQGTVTILTGTEALKANGEGRKAKRSKLDL